MDNHNGARALLICLVVAALPRASAAASATLSWDANSEPDIAGYRIYYDSDPGDPYEGTFSTTGPSPIEYLLEDLDDPANPSVTLAGIPTCMYVYFAATAFNTSGLESDYSNEVAKTVVDPPEGLVVLPGGAEGELFIAWETLAVGDTGSLSAYRVHYGFVSGEPYSGTGADQGDSPIDVAGDAGSLSLSGLTPGATVYVMVEAVCADGETDPSEEASGTVAVAECGNDVIESGETCDPPSSCPSTCADGSACTTDVLVGDPAICSSRCRFDPVDECVDGDDCCPAGCIHDTDSDCSVSCGDFVVDEGETCDPPSTCPTSCSDGDPCTFDNLVGAASTCNAACTSSTITSCEDGDGCCPTGCTSNTDSNCSASCGDGVVGDGETCDPPESCPTSCNDGNSCTSDSMSGSAANCNAICSNPVITTCAHGDGCCPASCSYATDNDCSTTCGNGTIDPGETCDPPSSCPATCPSTDSCTVGTLTGGPANCNAQCSYATTIACQSGDGCCPLGCSPVIDADCYGPGPTPPGTPTTTESTGCSCATPGSGPPLSPLAAVLLAVLPLALWRRARRR